MSDNADTCRDCGTDLPAGYLCDECDAEMSDCPTTDP